MKQKLLTGFNLRAILAFLFLSSVPITHAQYCESAFYFAGDYDYITNVTFGGINNSTGFDNYTPADFTAQSTNVIPGNTYPISVTIFADAYEYIYVYIDWNQDEDFDDTGETYIVAEDVSTDGPHTFDIDVPAGASGGSTRMRVMCVYDVSFPDACMFDFSGESEDYTINVLTSSCSGIPAPGNTLSSSGAGACPNANFTLSLQNPHNEIGISYQWQSSSDGVTYTNIPGATNSTYTTSQATATYYQAVLACNAGTPGTSNPIQLGINAPIYCYCSSYPQESSDTEIMNVTLGSLNNSSTCSSTAGPGSISNQYSNYTAVTAPGLARGVTYQLSVSVGTCSGEYENMTKVYIDYNQDGDFEDAGEEVYVSSDYTDGIHTETGDIQIPMGAVLGTTRMRVITSETMDDFYITPCGNSDYYYGETEDYFVTIEDAPSCPQPTGIVWLSGTTATADFSWTPGGTETEWIVQYGAPGFTLGSGTITPPITTNPETQLTGLAPNSLFQFYVKAVCSPTEDSYYTGPFSFNTYGFGQYIDYDTDCGSGFINISQNASATNLQLTDDAEAGITLPFPIYYQGMLVSQVTVGNNGGIKFNTLSAQVEYSMDQIGVYPFIQDLGTPTTGGNVYMQVLGSTPNRKLVVQWNNIPHYSFPATTNGVTFEFVFEEATSEFYFHYDDIDFGNPDWNNGADAEIGVRGPQNIEVSMNNPTFLQNNECVHFFYTDCPKPKQLQFSNIAIDEFSMEWLAGMANEQEWAVEYGVQGFLPGTGTMLTDITSPEQQISGLNPLTTYDVYVYAACANGDVSLALMGSVQTLPLCADPYGLNGSAAPDSIFATWLWTETQLPISGFNLQYGLAGFGLYGSGSTQVGAGGFNFADTIHDANFMAGVTYDVYVQSVCDDDTSNFVGPFTIRMPLSNDSVCGAEMLMTNGTVYTFNNTGATVSPMEQSIAPPNTGLQMTNGWGSSTLTYTTWFKFIAPASGQVRISGTDLGFDGQMAVYATSDCGDYGDFEMIAANDNEIGGSSLAPNFTVCGLTAGNTYYLLHDSYTTYTTGNYSIKITPVVLQAGSAGSLLEICSGDEVSLFDGITGNDEGGTWIPVIPSIQLSNDSIFVSAGLAYQTFQFQYRMTDGCAYDSILASVKVFAPSSAGNNGSIILCRNEPANLLAGLQGNADLNGTWYDPDSAPVPGGSIIGENFPGQYNYKYIVGNGVCPNDTAIVIVSIQNCNYLGINETFFEGFSLYPNPAEGFVYITNTGSTSIFNYEVLDLNGRIVTAKDNAVNGSSTTEIDLNKMETGVYLIRVFNEEAEKTFQVFVK